MLTRNQVVIRQDCLGYLMERYNDHVPRRDSTGAPTQLRRETGIVGAGE